MNATISRRDAGVLRYIPAAGFTEIGPSTPSVHVLKPAAFEALFDSDAVIKLRAKDVNVRRFGSTAVVTGVVSPEVRERAVRMVPETAAKTRRCMPPWWSRSPKIACALQTLWTWVHRHKVNSGVRDGVTAAEAQRVKEL